MRNTWCTRDTQTGLYYRPACGDIEMLEQQEKVWRPLQDIDFKEATALDLGANIGLFVYWCKKHTNISRFICVEPDLDNIEVFLRNWPCEPEVELLKGVVGARDGIETLFMAPTYPATSSIIPVKGREKRIVTCWSLQTLISMYQPTLIKCDIEGGEWLLDWRELPTCVTEIDFEYHQRCKLWTLELQIAIDNILKSQGFRPIVEMKHLKLFTGNGHATYTRRPR